MDYKAIECPRCKHINDLARQKCYFCGNILKKNEFEICSRCHTKHHQSICPMCGLKRKVEIANPPEEKKLRNRCFLCGGEVDKDLKYCPNCGAKQNRIENVNGWQIVGAVCLFSGLAMFLAMLLVEAEMSSIITSVTIPIIGALLYGIGMYRKRD